MAALGGSKASLNGIVLRTNILELSIGREYEAPKPYKKPIAKTNGVIGIGISRKGIVILVSI